MKVSPEELRHTAARLDSCITGMQRPTPWRSSMKWFRDESGQVLVMTFFCMAVLLGFLGLAIDVGVLFHARRNMQAVADAAAMAGATEMFYNGSTNVDTTAKAAAKAMGVDSTVTGNTVNVVVSPTLAPGGVACPSCVQVQVATPNPTIFIATMSQWFFSSSTFNSVNVSAMATAGSPGFSQNCVWLMDPTMGGKKGAELDLQGGAKSNVVVKNCGIYLNSNASDAVGITGNPNLTAGVVNIVGNDTAAVSALSPTPVNINVPSETPDLPLDLSGLPGPCTVSNSATSISHGTGANSDGAINTAISGSLASPIIVCFTGNNVQLANGVVLNGAAGAGVLYAFENGVKLAGSVQLGSATASPVGCTTDCTFKNTQGAVLDIDGGGFSQGNAALSIYAPTSGAYNSIALMQPSSNTTDNKCPAAKASPCLLIQRGNSGSVFDGMIYAPGEYVELQDAAGGVYATGLIAKGLYNKTSGMYIVGYSQSNPNTTPFKLITLVQ